MEKLLSILNGFGLYQKLLLILIGLINILAAISVYSSIFTTAQHQIICRNKMTNASIVDTCTHWEKLRNKTDLEKKNTPFECHLNHQYYGSTMVSEWGFQCGQMHRAVMVTSVYMSSQIFTFIGGFIGDKYGRRCICIVSGIGMMVASVVSEILMTKFGLVNNMQYLIFTIGQFFIGVFGNCLFCASLIIACEFSSLKYHTFVSSISLFIYVLGELLVPIIYYATYNWHSINISIGVLSTIVTMLILTTLPESPRYLIANKRYEECFDLLTKIARINTKSEKMFSKDQFFKQIESNENGTIGIEGSHINFHEIQSLLSIRVKPRHVHEEIGETEMQIIEKHAGSVWFFMFNPVWNFVTTVLMCVVWVSVSIVYYGISLGITSIDVVNPYLMYVLSCIAEIIGTFLCILNEKFSRKVMLLWFLLSAGLLVFLTVLMPIDQPNEMTYRTFLLIGLTLLGKVLAAAAINSAYVYTVRMFPASVRGTLFTLCLSVSRFGSVCAPLVNMLKTLVWAPMPYVIFSGSTVVAGICLVILPDPSRLH